MPTYRFRERDILIQLETAVVPPNYFAEIFLSYLVKRQEPLGAVLDLGCGTGILGMAAYATGAKSVTAIDIDPAALRLARRNWDTNGFPPDRLTCIHADLSTWSTRRRFKTVLCNPPQTPTSAGDMDAGRSGGQDGLRILIPAIECASRHITSGQLVLTVAEFLDHTEIVQVAKRLFSSIRTQMSVECVAGPYTRSHRSQIEANGFKFKHEDTLSFVVDLWEMAK